MFCLVEYFALNTTTNTAYCARPTRLIVLEIFAYPSKKHVVKEPELNL